jgi:hypothetical protein
MHDGKRKVNWDIQGIINKGRKWKQRRRGLTWEQFFFILTQRGVILVN